MGQIRWTLTAQADLKNIGDYIAKDSSHYAVEFVDRVIQHVEKLTQFPRKGRVVPEFEDENIRELIFHNYRIVYAKERRGLYVLIN